MASKSSSTTGDREHEEEDLSLAGSEQIRRAHEDRNRDRRKLTKKPERQSFGTIEQAHPDNLLSGRIIRTEGAFFVARLESGEEMRSKSYKGTRTSNPRATLVAVGDRVKISPQDEEIAIIEEVLERKTKLARKAAGRRDAFEQVIVSNIDTLVIVASIKEPPLRPGIIDRYIVAGLEGGLEIVLVINKIDLASEEELDEVLYFQDVYSELGYKVFPVSSSEGTGIDTLRASLAGKTSVFAGHSGVGKSSIINAVFGKEVGKTGVLSRKFKRGAHTTTSSVLMPVEGLPDSYVVDTPGVREFSNFELDAQNLKFFFPEFAPYQALCKITNCTHLHEPGCAVRQALEEDKISIERYSSYTKLFEEATAAERRRIDKQ
jgi:ribosome biogenesis GTPase